MRFSAPPVHAFLYTWWLMLAGLANGIGAKPPAMDGHLDRGSGVDVIVTKQIGVDSTVPGAPLRYMLTVSNQTATVAQDVVVTEVIPAGTVFDVFAIEATGWSCPDGASAGSTCTIEAGNLGGLRRIGFPVRVLDIVPAGVELITNTVTAADDGSSGADLNPADNTATVSIPVIAAPDLMIEMDEIGTVATVGSTIEYVLIFGNDGNQDASGVVIEAAVPDFTQFDSSLSSPGWSCADGAVAGTPCQLAIGLVPGGGGVGMQSTLAVTVVGPIPAGVDAIEANASIEDDGLSGPDANPTNNQASDMTPFLDGTVAPDLVISKDEEGMSAAPGSTIVYDLAYRNDGTQGATGIVIEEQVPLHTRFDAGSASVGWNCGDGAPAGTLCRMIFASLAGGGGSGMTQFAVTVDPFLPTAVKLIRNTVSISDDGSNGDDLDPTNNLATDVTPLVDAAPDLVITKNDVGDLAAAGETIRYSLVARNDGSQASTGVVIIETVPEHTRFDLAESSMGWTCGDGAPPGTLCTVELGSLAGGGGVGAATFAVIVDEIVPAGVEAIENTAMVDDDGTNGPDVNPTNNQSTDMTPLSPETAPDLVIAKDDVGTSATPGGLVTYNLAFHNDGTQDATGVVLEDTVPENTAFDANASDPAWSCVDGDPAGTLCQLSIGFVAGGGGGGLAVFAARVDESLPAGVETLTNTATIGDDGAGGADLNPSNNQSTDMTPLDEGTAPDLALTKDDVGTSASPGSTIAYQLAYLNDGPQAATGVVLRETVPEHTSFDQVASTPGWSCADAAPAGTPCTFVVGDLPGGGGTGMVDFAVRVDVILPAGVDAIVNTASIEDDGTNGVDLNPSNNQSTDMTPLSSDAAPDLVITKTDGAITADPGDVIVYRLDVLNDGTQAATGVRILEDVPVGTRFEAASSTPGWSCVDGASAGAACQLDIGSLAGGGGMDSVEFAVRVLDTLPPGLEAITNVAVIEDDGTNGADLNLDNNQATDTTPLSATAAPDIALSKSDGDITAVPGVLLGYTLSLENLGTQSATGVFVEEIVPDGSTFAAGASTDGWSCADGAAAGTICSFDLGALEPGAVDVLDFAIRVDESLPAGLSRLTNMAAAEDDGTNGADLDPTNNIAVVSTTIDRSLDGDLAIDKRDDDATIMVGGTVVYTITATNRGSVPLSAVSIYERVPLYGHFVAGQSTAGWSCPDGAPPYSACFYEIGTLDGGASVELAYAIELRTAPPEGVTELFNEAKGFFDQTLIVDPDHDNTRDTETTPIGPSETVDVQVELLEPSMTRGAVVIEAEVTIAGAGSPDSAANPFKADRDERKRSGRGAGHTVRITAELSVPDLRFRMPEWTCAGLTCTRDVELGIGDVELVSIDLGVFIFNLIDGWRIQAWPLDATDPEPSNNVVGAGVLAPPQ